MRQQGSALTGTFEEGPLLGSSPLKGAVFGSIHGRQVRLQGALAWRSEVHNLDGRADLEMTGAELQPDGHTFSGSFVLIDRRKDGVEGMRRTCQILTLRRQQP